MPKKRKPHPLFEHSIIVPILKVSFPITLRRRKLPAGAVLLVTAAEDQLLKTNSALMRLMAHTAKLDHAIHFLKQAGRTKQSGSASLQMLGPSAWVEYHLGYFYALHRSTYDSAMWFTSESLNMSLPKNMGFDKKFYANIAKTEALLQVFKKLKLLCAAFVEPRNDHLHRGQYVRSGPVVGGDVLDQLLVADNSLNLLKRQDAPKYDAAAHKEIREMLKGQRLVLIAFLEEEVRKIHALLVNLIDILEPALRAQMKNAEENKMPA